MKRLTVAAAALVCLLGCTKEQQAENRKTGEELKRDTQEAAEKIKSSEAAQKIKSGAKQAGQEVKQEVKKGAGVAAEKAGKKLEEWGKKAQH